jgi:hypothetical protein
MDNQTKIWDLDEDHGTDLPTDGQAFKGDAGTKLDEPIVLTDRDRDMFLNALKSPPKPNATLTAAMLSSLKPNDTFTLPRGARFKHALYGSKVSKRSHAVKAVSVGSFDGTTYVTWMGANSYECTTSIDELVRAFGEGFAKEP